MKKLNKGALVVVLAGSVTFAAANALLLDNPTFKRLAKINTITHFFGDLKFKNTNKKAKKVAKNPMPTSDVNDVQTPSDHKSVSQTAKDENKSAMTATSNKQKTEVIQQAAKKPVKTDTTTTSAKTSPTASKPPKTTTSETTTSGTTTTNSIKTTATTVPSKTTTTHGQEVSQMAKEKAASHQDNRGNNGKNM